MHVCLVGWCHYCQAHLVQSAWLATISSLAYALSQLRLSTTDTDLPPQLGIPTANIPPSGLDAHPNLESGVYFGFVGLKVTAETRQSADNRALTLGEAGQETPAAAASGRGVEVEGCGMGGGQSESIEGKDKEKHGEKGGSVAAYPAVLSIG